MPCTRSIFKAVPPPLEILFPRASADKFYFICTGTESRDGDFIFQMFSLCFIVCVIVRFVRAQPHREFNANFQLLIYSSINYSWFHVGNGPDPEFIEPLSNITVVAGRDVKLQCNVRHLGSFKVKQFFSSFLLSAIKLNQYNKWINVWQVAWIYMDKSAILTVQNHVITRNPRISVYHDQHHTWTLHITSVQESDRGGYM